MSDVASPQSKPNAAAILVVDDDEDTCANLADILGELGYAADTAFRGRDAIELTRQHDYALAVLDFRLPCMTGLELFHQIQGVRRDIQAVIVTAYSTPDVEQAAVREGVRRVMPKPLNFEDLVGVVREVVGEPD